MALRKHRQLGTPESAKQAKEMEADAARDVAAAQAEASTQEEKDDAPRRGRGPLSWWRERKEQRELAGQFDSYPHLLALKPRERYLFRSDYYEVDSSYACVLAYFHDDAAQESYGAFWGIDKIPDGLDESVTAVVLEQVRRMTDSWIDRYTKDSERLTNIEAHDQAESGTISSQRKARKYSADIETILAEIQSGASYLHVHSRLLLKAPSLEILEETVEKITRQNIDRFGTLQTAPYHGEQRQELQGLLRQNAKKRGKGLYFTSPEFAGSYSLVTNGLNDRNGEYCGYLVGDKNDSAVLFDVNGYDHHVVVADSAIFPYLDRQRVSNMWCSKIAQSALLSNGKVVHIVLDGADLNKLGPSFSRLTSRVDLNQGDVNPFEMFGDREDELAIFASQMIKLRLMFEQLYDSPDGAVASIIGGALETVATKFYINWGMWHHNAKEQRHRLRVVGIPHEDVPRLALFKSYLETAYKEETAKSTTDQDQVRALNVLRSIVNTMLSTNGDLFNNHTSSAVDGVRDSRRVIYDFSRLMRRGKGVAMAQLVNIFGFAVGALGPGDTVIIHGTEKIEADVQEYLDDQLSFLFERGGRVVYSYNDIDKMLADSDFNRFDAADYQIFGAIRDKTVVEYERQLHQKIPPDLARLITNRGATLTYLRRGVSNVVFHMDLALGINPAREAQRRRIRLETVKEKEAAQMAELLDGPAQAGAKRTTSRVDAGDQDGSIGDGPAALRRTSGRKSLQPDEGRRSPARAGRSLPTRGPIPHTPTSPAEADPAEHVRRVPAAR